MSLTNRKGVSPRKRYFLSFPLIKTIKHMNFQNVFDSIKKTNGASYNFFTGEMNPEKGYMVALAGYDHKFPVPESILEFKIIVRRYLDFTDVWKELNKTDDEKLFIGFWLHGNELIIDLTELVDDLEDAWEKGIERFQLAIYDNENKQDVILPTVGF